MKENKPLLLLFTSFLLLLIIQSPHISFATSSEQYLRHETDMGVAVEPPITEKRILIDDFDDGDLINRLDGPSGVWDLDAYNEYTSCVAEVVEIPAPEISRSVLKLSYDVNSPNHSQNGFWTNLMDYSIAGYDQLEFFVRGDENSGYTSTFKIEIKKYLDDQREEKLTGSYIVKDITSKWQKISIPLNQFNAINSWENLSDLVIIFNDKIVDKREGTLYFDNFQFVNTGFKLPNANDARGSTIQKTQLDCTPNEWAQWLSQRLKGYPSNVVIKKDFPKDDKDFLMEIARDTWRFFDEVVDKKTALPLDRIVLGKKGVFEDGCSVGDYTNVTNIGLYLISLVAGYDLNFISKDDVISRIIATIKTIESVETYKYFLFNYYDTTTTEKTSNFISMVDSGWLACGIYIVKNAFSEDQNLVSLCEKLLSEWDFSFFYDPIEGKFFHGFYHNINSFANYHYGTFYTEPRIVSYLAIARGDVPFDHWFKLDRTLPENYSWQQQIPKNRNLKNFRGINYFGGYYEYENKKFIPSWGGSLFEALMPTILLQEKVLAPESLGLNNQIHSEIHASYATEKLNYPVWGMSPCAVPGGGYSEFGINFLGLKGYKSGVITPHVTFLALDYIPELAIHNMRTMIKEYDVYGEYGFYDALDPISKEVEYKYLCLDQAMIFISIDNYLNNGIMRKRFHNDPIIKKAEYLIKEENLFTK
jgi:hypothetical protein